VLHYELLEISRRGRPRHTHGRNYNPNIGGAEIAENKIKRYLIVITIDYIDLKKKNRSSAFELRDAKSPIAPP
jgi:hypothetical protein